eukprot:ctg_224.g156
MRVRGNVPATGLRKPPPLPSRHDRGGGWSRGTVPVNGGIAHAAGSNADGVRVGCGGQYRCAGRLGLEAGAAPGAVLGRAAHLGGGVASAAHGHDRVQVCVGGTGRESMSVGTGGQPRAAPGGADVGVCAGGRPGPLLNRSKDAIRHGVCVEHEPVYGGARAVAETRVQRVVVRDGHQRETAGPDGGSAERVRVCHAVPPDLRAAPRARRGFVQRQCGAAHAGAQHGGEGGAGAVARARRAAEAL